MVLWVLLSCSGFEPLDQVFCADVCAVDPTIFDSPEDEDTASADTASADTASADTASDFDACLDTCYSDPDITQPLLSCMSDGANELVVTVERLEGCRTLLGL